MKITKTLKYRSKNVKNFIKLPPAQCLCYLYIILINVNFETVIKQLLGKFIRKKNLVYARDSKLSFVDSNIAGFEGY